MLAAENAKCLRRTVRHTEKESKMRNTMLKLRKAPVLRTGCTTTLVHLFLCVLPSNGTKPLMQWRLERGRLQQRRLLTPRPLQPRAALDQRQFSAVRGSPCCHLLCPGRRQSPGLQRRQRRRTAAAQSCAAWPPPSHASSALVPGRRPASAPWRWPSSSASAAAAPGLSWTPPPARGRRWRPQAGGGGGRAAPAPAAAAAPVQTAPVGEDAGADQRLEATFAGSQLHSDSFLRAHGQRGQQPEQPSTLQPSEAC